MAESISKRTENLEPYRLHLLQDTRLNKRQQRMMVHYRRANALMCAGYSLEQTAVIIRRECDCSESHSYRIVRQSIQIYGDVKAADKAGLRHVMYENFMVAASMARKAGDFSSMNRALENAAKIYDLYNAETLQFDPADFKLRREIVYSDAEEVLAIQEGGVVEEVDDEE